MSTKLVKALKKKREADGLSIRALSAKIGVSFSTLARIERGEGDPDNNSTIRILNWLGNDAQELGLSLQHTAMVHFRAAKNVGSKTVQCLLQAAELIQKDHCDEVVETFDDRDSEFEPTIPLSKSEMEDLASELREELSVPDSEPLDALDIQIFGVDVLVPANVNGMSQKCLAHLVGPGKGDWSAMSVPLDSKNSRWVILRNDTHSIERQRVTYLEECWHILLGHRLTRIAKVADAYGRTYDSNEEHDAYYLAAATLLPKWVLIQAIEDGLTAADIASQYGVSTELVEYRIKRLGLWKTHKGISVKLAKNS